MCVCVCVYIYIYIYIYIRVVTGEENFPPVNRPDVTLVITVSPGGGGAFEFFLFSSGFKYPASALHVLF